LTNYFGRFRHVRHGVKIARSRIGRFPPIVLKNSKICHVKIPAKFGRERFCSFSTAKNWLRRFLTDYS
jgi:hypothetical protein